MDNWNFAGVKLQLAVQRFPANDPRLVPVYHGLEKRGKLLVIHAGTAPYLGEGYDFPGLDYLLPVLEGYPELKIQLPHLGLYEAEKAVRFMENFPSLYLDTSWVLGNPQADYSPARPAGTGRAVSGSHTLRQ